MKNASVSICGRWESSREWVLMFVCALIVALAAMQPIFNLDYGWHLASGRWMWQHKAWLTADPFSFTVYGHRWINHEWLFQLLLFAAHSLAGVVGVHLLKSFLLAIAAAGVWKSLPPKWPASFRSLFVLGTFYALSFRNMVRADLVSMAFLPWMIVLWNDMWRAGQMSRRQWLAATLLMLIWVNSHAAFWIAWVMVGCLAWAWRYRPPSPSAMANPFWVLGLTFLAVSVLNPDGFHLLTGTWQTTQFLAGSDRAEFNEYLRTPWRHFEGYWLFVLVSWLVTLRTWIRNRRMEWSELFSLAVGTALGALFIRNIPFAVFLILPVLLSGVEMMFSERNPLWVFRHSIDRSGGVVLVILAALALVTVKPIVQWDLFPVRAAQFVAEQLKPGPLYNPYPYGGYLIDRLDGLGFQIFLDGRMHAITGYRDVWYAEKKSWELSTEGLSAWQALCARWPFDQALIRVPNGKPMYRGKPISLLAYHFPPREWALVFYQDHAAVYVRRAAYPPEWVKQHEMVDWQPDLPKGMRWSQTVNPTWPELFQPL